MLLVIKKTTEEIKEIDISKSIGLNVKKGEHFYLDNSKGFDYKINLVESKNIVQLQIESEPTIKITFNNMLPLLSNKQALIGLINTKEGLTEFTQVVNADTNYDSNIIDNLKELLSQSSLGKDIKDGIIIDDFTSLTNALSEIASGEDNSSASKFIPNIELEDSLSYEVGERTKFLDIASSIDNKDNIINIKNNKNNNFEIAVAKIQNSLLEDNINLQNLDISRMKEEVSINLENGIKDYLVFDSKTIDELITNEEIIKIFADETKGDKIVLEASWQKATIQEIINEENFNIYQNGTSNIKLLIDEDAFVEAVI